jgi:hypothetical protein
MLMRAVLAERIVPYAGADSCHYARTAAHAVPALQQLPAEDLIVCAVLGFGGWKLHEHPIPHHVRHPAEVFLTQQVECMANGAVLMQHLAYLR